MSLVGRLGHELERLTGELALADLARSVDPVEWKLSTPACGLGDGKLRHAALVNERILAATTEGDEGPKLPTGRLRADEAGWLIQSHFCVEFGFLRACSLSLRLHLLRVCIDGVG